MSEAPYKSSLIEALRGSGVPGATMGGNVQFLNFPWMQNTDVALRQRPAKSYLASPELLEYADLPYIPPAPKGGGMSAVPPGVPNPNTIGETIPEKKAEPAAVQEAAPAVAPKGELVELREQEKPGVITIEELPSLEEVPQGLQPELEKDAKTGVITVEELAEQPAPAPSAREVLSELIPEEEKPEPQATVTVEELASAPTVRAVLSDLVPQEEQPEASVTVEELPPEMQEEPTLEEVIDYINALTQATATEPEAEAEPEVSVTVEELPPETAAAPDGRGGSMPFVTSLAREMAMLAALGDMLGTANDPKGEITIEELIGE